MSDDFWWTMEVWNLLIKSYYHNREQRKSPLTPASVVVWVNVCHRPPTLIQYNRLPLSSPRGQELIFLWSTCCSGFLSLCKRGGGGEAWESVWPPYFPEHRWTPATHALAHGEAHLSRGFAGPEWAQIKRRDDQRPLIALRGVDEGCAHAGKGRKRTRKTRLTPQGAWRAGITRVANELFKNQSGFF